MSRLPRTVTEGYWAEVRRVLRSSHRLSPIAASRGVAKYRRCLNRDGVGDVIYHSDVTETANGIVRGGYAAQGE